MFTQFVPTITCWYAVGRLNSACLPYSVLLFSENQHNIGLVLVLNLPVFFSFVMYSFLAHRSQRLESSVCRRLIF